jgi:replicative DNA helicase
MLLGALSENLITLLAYDDKHALLIRSLVEPQLFGGHTRLIAARIYDYIDRFKKSPKDHLPDILMDKLEDPNKREAELYLDTIQSIVDAKDNINAEYVISSLETFIKRQSLRAIAVDLNKALIRDTDESLEEAAELMAKANTQTLKVFDPGVRLSDKRALSFLDLHETALPTGIPELDRRGFGPTRKELWQFIANTKSGKTFCLIQLGKMAALHKFRVCHISLEMSWERCAQRYYSAFFGISKRKETFTNTRFKRDQLNRITGYEDVRVTPKLSYDDPRIDEKLGARIDKWSDRLLDNIIVRDFPTGDLTVWQLEAYLDNLEQVERFTPDLLIIDYPALMRIDKDNYRLALDEIYKQIRGLCKRRNMAGAIVSQSHRAAAKAKTVGIDNIAENYAANFHCDTSITYSQTTQERKLNLARLFVGAGRNDSDKITIVISQQYGLGSFVIDSNLLIGQYFENLPRNGFEDDEET